MKYIYKDPAQSLAKKPLNIRFFYDDGLILKCRWEVNNIKEDRCLGLKVT